VEEPENLGGAQVVFRAAFAQKPFHESLLSDGQKPVRKAALQFRRAQIKLEHALARIAAKRGADIFHGAMGKAQRDRGAGAKPFAIRAFFSFRDRSGITASQFPAVAQHS